MDFKSRQEGHITVLALGGRLDAVTAPGFEQRAREMIASGSGSVVIDLDGLDYISSAGLRALLVMAKLLKEKGAGVCLANAGGNVKSVFEMSGFTSIFKIEDTLEAAIAAVS